MADPIITITIDEAQRKAYAVLSSQGELPTLEEVLNASKAENVPFWIDEAAIAKALENRLLDQPFEIGHAKDGRVVVTVAAGEMEAYMLVEPAYGGKKPDLTDAKQALGENSITVGVDETAIKQALADGNHGSKVLIGRGKTCYRNGRHNRIPFPGNIDPQAKRYGRQQNRLQGPRKRRLRP